MSLYHPLKYLGSYVESHDHGEVALDLDNKIVSFKNFWGFQKICVPGQLVLYQGRQEEKKMVYQTVVLGVLFYMQQVKLDWPAKQKDIN